MNESIKQLFTDKIIFVSALFAFILLFFHGFFALLSFSKLPSFIPLFNQMPWGETRLGTKIQMFIPFGIATSIWISNCVAMLLIYNKMPLVARLLAVTSFLVSLLALFVIVRTILIVF